MLGKQGLSFPKSLKITADKVVNLERGSSCKILSTYFRESSP